MKVPCVFWWESGKIEIRNLPPEEACLEWYTVSVFVSFLSGYASYNFRREAIVYQDRTMTLFIEDG